MNNIPDSILEIAQVTLTLDQLRNLIEQNDISFALTKCQERATKTETDLQTTKKKLADAQQTINDLISTKKLITSNLLPYEPTENGSLSPLVAEFVRLRNDEPWMKDTEVRDILSKRFNKSEYLTRKELEAYFQFLKDGGK